ncbi:hypothetical protein IAU60_002377 [Kwoniella sp. DSM 27419]
MSRHRDVRNMDLDEELDDEEDTGMTQEEQAQMATAMPIARSLLKGIKPPIPDETIADSLWHYWFDVDKAVSWLKQDAERKGEAPPSALQPTPAQQPRRRPRNLFSSIPSTSAPSDAADDSLQPPLTALQRLSLARKQGGPSTASASGVKPAESSSTGSPNPDTPTKPLSKLALLAQKRREAAAQAAEPSQNSTPSRTSSGLAADAAKTTAVDSTPKPLSKLAQKMAAARAAREEAAAKSNEAQVTDESLMDVDTVDTPGADPASQLFALASSPPRSAAPSAFFTILTKTTSKDTSAPIPGVLNLHVPLATDVADLKERFEHAFAESPDELVLRKRQGRAGTAEMATAIKKQARGTGAKPT